MQERACGGVGTLTMCMLSRTSFKMRVSSTEVAVQLLHLMLYIRQTMNISIHCGRSPSVAVEHSLLSLQTG